MKRSTNSSSQWQRHVCVTSYLTYLVVIPSFPHLPNATGIKGEPLEARLLARVRHGHCSSALNTGADAVALDIQIKKTRKQNNKTRFPEHSFIYSPAVSCAPIRHYNFSPGTALSINLVCQSLFPFVCHSPLTRLTLSENNGVYPNACSSNCD